MPYREKYSYVKAVRDIEPTAELTRFLRKVRRIGSYAIGIKDTASLSHLPANDSEDLEEKPLREQLGISNVRIEDDGDLEYVQYERRALPNLGLNGYMGHIYARFGAGAYDRQKNANRAEYRLPGELAAIEGKYGLNNHDQLELPISGIEEITRAEPKARGLRLGLCIADSPVAYMLLEQNQAIFSAVKSTGQGQHLTRDQAPNDQLTIPFAWLPGDIELERQVFFEKWVAHSLEENPLTLLADTMHWDGNAQPAR